MSQNCMEDVVVKEEYVVEETNDNYFNNLLVKPDPTRKCGEVFLSHRGTFTFVCTQCLQTFPDLHKFGEHIRDLHLLPKVEPLEPNDNKTPLKSEPPDQADYDLQYYDEEAAESSGMAESTELSVDLPTDKGNEQSNEESSEKTAKSTKRHKLMGRKTYCCYSCGKIFVGFAAYQNHYRVEHSDMIEKDELTTTGSSAQTSFVPKIPKEMMCKYCLCTFDEPASYHNHMKLGHPGPKRYSCPQCPRMFGHKNSRDYHVDMHDGKKRFQCPHCSKAFSHPTNLRDHVNIHLKIKPYCCQYCGQNYTQPSALKSHERIHTKKRPHISATSVAYRL